MFVFSSLLLSLSLFYLIISPEQDCGGASVQHQGTATVQTDRNLCWGGSRCAEVSLSWW